MSLIVARPRPAAELRATVREAAENRPGVYRMVGPNDAVLYVGKSIRVRTRLLSYFRAAHGEKAAEIIAHTHRIEWDHVPNEFAALLHEMRLIRQWRPPFNVVHKRDRSFCFIKLTREEAPRLLVVREVAADGGLHFGPFQGPDRVRATVREVSDLLELRDCSAGTRLSFADQLDFFGHIPTPLCLRADVGKCLAPCAGRCTRGEYVERTEVARRFLEGDADAPLAILRGRMELAAARLQFEYASELRDRADRLEQARDELLSLRGTIEALSFVYQVPGYGGDDRVYIIRRGSVRAEMPAPRTGAERLAILEKAERVFSPAASRAGSVRPAQAAEILLLARWFRRRPLEMERVWPDAMHAEARARLHAICAMV